VWTAQETFGISGDALAYSMHASPQTPDSPGIATAPQASKEPVAGAGALVDPRGSAGFWIAVAAILGLVLVTGKFKVEAALGGRAGRA
jgi:hypothetical protein